MCSREGKGTIPNRTGSDAQTCAAKLSEFLDINTRISN